MTIDVREPVRELCRGLGLDESYVAHVDLNVGRIEVTLYKGKDGRCKGAKYIDESGEPAMETLTFEDVLT